MIKLIISDMDGTLLDDNKGLNDEFYEVYNELRKRDIRFAVASGRHFSEMHKYFRAQYKDMIYISENGGQIIYEDKEIYANPMNMDYIFKIAEDAIKIDGVEIVLSGGENLYLYNFRKKPIEDIRNFYFDYKILNNPADLKERVFKISVYNENGSDYDTHKILYDNWGDKLKVIASSPIWTDIHNKEVNKGVAVNVLKEKFGIRDEEIMVFGDYNNDIEMLEQSQNSYAMENASIEIKNVAKFIAKSNNENGVLEVIKNIVLV